MMSDGGGVFFCSELLIDHLPRYLIDHLIATLLLEGVPLGDGLWQARLLRHVCSTCAAFSSRGALLSVSLRPARVLLAGGIGGRNKCEKQVSRGRGTWPHVCRLGSLANPLIFANLSRSEVR